jgi:TrmH family RNA methyltransferase
VKNFVQACDAKFEFETVVISHVLLKSSMAEMLARRLKAAGVERIKVTPEEFRELRAVSGGDTGDVGTRFQAPHPGPLPKGAREFRKTGGRASGIGAIVRQRWVTLEQLMPREGATRVHASHPSPRPSPAREEGENGATPLRGEQARRPERVGGIRNVGAAQADDLSSAAVDKSTAWKCWLVVEQIRSAGNLGCILRTAQACGVAGVIFVGPYCDPFDPDVVRASMGGMFHLPLVRTTQTELGRWVKSRGVQCVGLSPDARALWSEFAVSGPMALVVGEEREGLSPGLRALCDTFVRLPMADGVDSINVSVATGVMLYELVRRGVSK